MGEDAWLDAAYEDRFESDFDNVYADHFCEDLYEDDTCGFCGADLDN